MDDKAGLIRELQHAHSGVLAAGFAYEGHWRSVKDPAERAHIKKIQEEEHHHLELVAGLLAQLGAKPLPLRDAIFVVIGKMIGLLCRAGGWFIPMYGAGRLESHNIVEYERAAMHAMRCGNEEMIECLLQMAEVEWEHEAYFRERVTGHPLLRIFPIWKQPPPKSTIRERYREPERLLA